MPKTIQSLLKMAKNIHEKEIWNGERPRQSRERSGARGLSFCTPTSFRIRDGFIPDAYHSEYYKMSCFINQLLNLPESFS